MYHGQDRYQFQTPIVKLDRRLRCWPKWLLWYCRVMLKWLLCDGCPSEISFIEHCIHGRKQVPSRLWRQATVYAEIDMGHIWEIDELIETARKQCDDDKHAK